MNVLTQAGVEEEILRLCSLLDDSVEHDLPDRALSAANSEAEYRVEYAKQILLAGNQPGSARNGLTTVDEREAIALVRCERLLRERLVSEALYETVKQRNHAIRTRIDALRTVSANLRGQT